MASIFRSPRISAASKLLKSAIVWSVCWWCSNAEPATSVNPTASSRLPLAEPATGWAGAPEGWTALTMVLKEGVQSQTVMIRDDADEAEFSAVIAEGCRDAGVSDEHVMSITTQWKQEKLKAWRSEQNRTGLVLNPSLKGIFQRFFGVMAGLAEEQPFHVLETGSWQGESASWIAEHVLKHPESILVCLDKWNGSPPPENSGYDMAAIEDRFRSNMARIPNGDRVVAFKGSSLESLANILASGLDSRFDAVFLDGSHEVGGVMIFDDYWMRGVAQATAAFEEALGDYLEVLHSDETHLVVSKAANKRFATHGSELLLGDSSRLQKLTSRNPTASTT